MSPSATGTIINTARVTSSTPDPNPDNNTATNVIDVIAFADISIVKTVSPSQDILPGERVTYTITVTNFGPADAQNVILDDEISPFFIGVEFSIDGGVTFNPWPTVYDLGTLAAGEIRTVLITGILNPALGNEAQGMTIYNTANVISTTPDPNLDNNTFPAITTTPKIEIEISVNSSENINPVIPEQTIIYTIDISNSGLADAENVVLLNNIPSSIADARFSEDGGITWKNWNGFHNIGTLPKGESTTTLIRGKVQKSNAKYITNTAKVTSATENLNPTSNISTTITKICKCSEVCLKYCCFEI